MRTTTSPPQTLIPVPEPILPASHPARKAVSSTMYRTIYSKVVLQGQTPNLPVNLQDMTNALVQGWKDDGEWPPKETSVAVEGGRKKGKGGGEGEGDGGQGKRMEMMKGTLLGVGGEGDADGDVKVG